MTEQLLQLGHRRIALLTGYDACLDAPKRMGVHDALRAAGIDPAQVPEFSAHGRGRRHFPGGAATCSSCGRVPRRWWPSMTASARDAHLKRRRDDRHPGAGGPQHRQLPRLALSQLHRAGPDHGAVRVFRGRPARRRGAQPRGPHRRAGAAISTSNPPIVPARPSGRYRATLEML